MYQFSIDGDEKRIDISDNDASTLKFASEKLYWTLSYERNFDYLVQNYLDYEKAIALNSLSHLIDENQYLAEISSHIKEFNVKLLNFFSTARAYIDKTPLILKEIIGNSDIFKEECSHHFDNNFSYRFIDALRNHAQHQGDGLSLLNIGSEWIERENLEFYTNPIIRTDDLRKTRNLRKVFYQKIQREFI